MSKLKLYVRYYIAKSKFKQYLSKLDKAIGDKEVCQEIITKSGFKNLNLNNSKNILLLLYKRNKLKL